MAEGDGKIYRTFKEDVLAGVHNLASGGNTIRVALVSGYTPNTVTNNVWADVSTNEVTGTGYTANGKALASQAVTETGTGTGTTGERGKFDADNVTWSGLNIGGTSGSPSHAVMYNDDPTTPADPLIAYWEVTTATNGGNYTLEWHTNGILILYGGT
jgi:hypothetical protein